MVLRVSTAVRDSCGDMLVGNLGVGGLCKIYTGSQPADADTAATGTLLATVIMDGAFNPSASGSVSTSVASTGNAAVASGVPGWARISTSTGTLPFDCTVGTSGADLIINSSPITSGGNVQVVSFTIGFPTL